MCIFAVLLKKDNMMTNEEFKQIMRVHDKKVGVFPRTIMFKDKRKERIEQVPDKVLFIASLLKEKGIDFHAYECMYPKKDKEVNIMTTLYIPSYKIAMRYVDMSSEHDIVKANYFYNLSKKGMWVFLIRSTESEEFLKVKLEDCISKAIAKPRPPFRKSFRPIPQLRARIKAVKVGR